MPAPLESVQRLPRRILAGCIAIALPAVLAAANAAAFAPAAIGTTRVVSNCDDQGTGSLRAALASAVSGDSIDLTQLSCSVITLTSGELSTAVDDLRISGVGTTITAGGSGRVLSHGGHGTLHAYNLILADGNRVGSPSVDGGCLVSQGNVDLWNVTVRDCVLASTPANPGITATSARGGGVFVRGNASLHHASILDNTIVPGAATYSYGSGGGIYVYGNVYAEKSTISGNTIVGGDLYVRGGGLASRNSAYIEYSTISGNSAYVAGGASFGSNGVSSVKNSTISGNHAQYAAGGIASSDSLLRIWNSTVAFNTVESPNAVGGILARGFSEYVSLRSSIVASNTAGGVASDVALDAWNGRLLGFDNLVIASTAPLPAGTLQVDPMLAPLADNGGLTPTHALLPGSPAIDTGSDVLLLPYDQRGEGYERVIGARADIGALEVQQPAPETIFANGFD